MKTSKRISSTIALLFIVICVGKAQTLQALFQKYDNDERFQYVSVGKGVINMTGIFGDMAKDEDGMMTKMKSIKILTLEEDINSALSKSVSNEISQLIATGSFKTAVEVRDKSQKVIIYYRVVGTDNADMLIVTREKDSISLIWINGKMTKQDMINSFSFTGEKNDTISALIEYQSIIS